MKFWQWLNVRTPNTSLFYSSLFGVLLLSLSSYLLSYIAGGQSNFDISYIGYYTMTQYSVMGLLMLLVWKTSPQSVLIKDYKLLLIVAVLARIVLLGVDSYTSNDVDRYLFDGRIAVEGIDPYRVSHDAPILKDLREQWKPPQEHAKYVTLYPPVALAFFSFVASTGIDNAEIIWKLILLIAGLTTLGLMVKVLQHAKKLEHLALIALSPLLILETGVGLHLDTLSTLAIVGAIYAWQRHKIVITGIVIAVGMLIKALPLMLLLPLVFTFSRFKNAVILVLSAIVTVITIYGLTINLGFLPVGSIGVFFEKWRFAAPLFTSLDNVLSPKAIVGFMLVFAIIMSSVMAFLCWKTHEFKSKTSILFGVMQLAVALPLLISPVIFPWYLMPLIPLIALFPNRFIIGWTLLMPLTYEVLGPFLSNQIWQPEQWPIWLIGFLQLTALFTLITYMYRVWPHIRKNNVNSDYC